MMLTGFRKAIARSNPGTRLRRITSLLLEIARSGHRPQTPDTPPVTSAATTPMPAATSAAATQMPPVRSAATTSTPVRLSISESDLERLTQPITQVERVDDPDCETSLLAVRGEIGLVTIGQLQDSLADLDRGRFVHLDLGSSSIRTTHAMRSLELIADDLEGRGIVLRVVGIDPQHPLLSPTL